MSTHCYKPYFLIFEFICCSFSSFVINEEDAFYKNASLLVLEWEGKKESASTCEEQFYVYKFYLSAAF